MYRPIGHFCEHSGRTGEHSTAAARMTMVNLARLAGGSAPNGATLLDLRRSGVRTNGSG
jgi:hypothetical protein